MISLSRYRYALLTVSAALLASAGPRPLSATTITVDYRYDSAGFFSLSTTSGVKARASVDAAASFFSTVLSDTLSAIPTPTGGNIWRQIIMHPGTGQANYTISSAAGPAQEAAAGWPAADEYRSLSVGGNQITIYAGATALSTLAVGGGGFASYGSPGFNDNISRRGKPADEFSTWGGYISFDNTDVAWHLDHQTATLPGSFDLYSTALHEIGHVLGLNPTIVGAGANAPQWRQWQLDAEFRGPRTLAAWKADDPAAPPAATGVPTASSTNTHWKDNATTAPRTASVRSYVLGTRELQEAAMDPTITPGLRKRFTNVDARALQDIGWTISSSVFDVVELPGDFTGDGLVNGADLARWKSSVGTGGLADADGDGDSDGRDFLLWQRHYGSALSAAAGGFTSAAVPEPGASGLVALAVILVGLSRCGAGLRRVALQP